MQTTTESPRNLRKNPRKKQLQSEAKALEEINELFGKSIPELIFEAQLVHREFNNPNEVQFCTLSSIKTGACPEDCGYCSQSARHNTELKVEALQEVNKVLGEAKQAKDQGSTRFCMGAAWRSIPEGQQFESVLEMIRGVRDMDMEPCVTLGMLTPEQAQELKAAGLHSYNHNIDTSRENYSNIIGTRTFEDRLETIAAVQDAGINVCSGGILGMGETIEDRKSMLASLASMEPQPSSVPINVLVPIAGTPLEDADPIDNMDLVRMVAIARIMLPQSRVRLSAGRATMSEELQALCFVAGANSIHTGDKLLTTPLAGESRDHKLMSKLGMSIAK
ncbi:MAG: biotin synthase BioB [Candidatus Melainabacteria bacterium]|nr:biotin synthase BioB [Candidatus Melainabacteria bacterium]